MAASRRASMLIAAALMCSADAFRAPARPLRGVAGIAGRRGGLAGRSDVARRGGLAGRSDVVARRAVLIVDHVNLNHEKGRHDLLKAFYFDLLGLTADPRKAENIGKGKKTLWANAGIAQLHLPEGAPNAQPLDGRLTLAYASLDRFDAARLEAAEAALAGTKFQIRRSPDGFDVVCPWGTPVSLKEDPEAADPRGAQPGDAGDALHIVDIALHVDRKADLAGVKRFYTKVMGVPAADATLIAGELLVLKIGPAQTLTFLKKPMGKAAHADLGEDDDGLPTNGGIHISMYVDDLGACYDAADALGLAFVNYRFKRRAHTKEEALDQCMFRVVDVVDPDAPEVGPIVQVEHEIRSTKKVDGSKYKSCPLREV
mmetsp:Transcript_28068/g.86841  ORF Transcript_28068/g.86841 Transcript_28068/m.86841 type:complete len:371 (+) Transcript_28068:151-1263(+)